MPAQWLISVSFSPFFSVRLFQSVFFGHQWFFSASRTCNSHDDSAKIEEMKHNETDEKDGNHKDDSANKLEP